MATPRLPMPAAEDFFKPAGDDASLRAARPECVSGNSSATSWKPSTPRQSLQIAGSELARSDRSHNKEQLVHQTRFLTVPMRRVGEARDMGVCLLGRGQPQAICAQTTANMCEDEHMETMHEAPLFR